jgi:serine/threonine protein kinase
MNKLANPVTVESTFVAYQIDEVLGEGGSGRVYGAKDPDGIAVAVKVLNERAPSDKRRRFKNELSFLATNKHPNIVTALDQGLARSDKISGPFYVMRRYECSLRELMRSGIDPRRVLLYFSQILDGVEAAHLKGVVHRDLKPENILFDANTDTLAVADFGAARFVEELLVTKVETDKAQRLANFQYAAPEQRTAGVEVGVPADIWALGMILNEMYTGAVPHGTDYKTISQVAPEADFLDEIVRQAIRQEPRERQTSIEQIKSQIMKYQFEAVTQQKLSAISNQVVTAKEIDDALALTPPRLINAEWRNGQLTLVLDRPVSAQWIQALYHMGNYSSIVGVDPGRFVFQGDQASVSVRDDQAQMVVDYFKSWLPNASAVLRSRLEAAEQERQRALREEFRRQKETEERNLKVNRTLKV